MDIEKSTLSTNVNPEFEDLEAVLNRRQIKPEGIPGNSSYTSQKIHSKDGTKFKLTTNDANLSDKDFPNPENVDQRIMVLEPSGGIQCDNVNYHTIIIRNYCLDDQTEPGIISVKPGYFIRAIGENTKNERVNFNFISLRHSQDENKSKTAEALLYAFSDKVAELSLEG